MSSTGNRRISTDRLTAIVAVKGDVSCASAGMTLEKKAGWDDSYLQSYAEQRMTLKGQHTVSNRVGQSVTVSSPAVGGTTAYLSLMTTWRNAGATATFSDFTYSAG
jgi:hypothetical protein